MFKGTVLCVQRGEAIRYATRFLSGIGLQVTGKCAPDVTHLLLPVPSFPQGDTYLAHLLAELPEDVILSGGNLRSALTEGYRCIDFLQDPFYLADNAAITADAALKILTDQLETDPSGCWVLVIGWGRIGKCLCRILQQKNARISVAARNPRDLAMIHALGCTPVTMQDVPIESVRCDVIINTVPHLLFPNLPTRPGCILMELASSPGITGEKIYDGRGLPGKIFPMRSGELIARTFLRLSI